MASSAVIVKEYRAPLGHEPVMLLVTGTAVVGTVAFANVSAVDMS